MTDTTDMNRFIDDLMSKMTLKEKIGQLNHPPSEGMDTTGIAKAVDMPVRIRRGEVGSTVEPNLEARIKMQEIAVNEGPNKIPLMFGVDVIHGHKTLLPIPLGLSCSWDTDLIERTAVMAAREARAEGISLNWSPMVDVCYDARWGRISEGNGEFPYLGARIAEAMVRGYQGPDNDMARPDRVMATVKHFAGYGLSARDYGSVEVSPSSLHSIMVPFKAAVDAGVGSLMVSFNTINNIPATVHQELLHDVLRKDWRFDGLAVTDFTAILEVVNHAVVEDLKEASYLSFKTGITTDMVSEGFMRYLPELVAEGKVSEEEIDTACRRVLEAKYKLGLFADPFMGMNEALRKSVTLTPEHRALAREAVAKSCVLLENKNSALPLKKDGKTIALIGPLADSKINMQGTWSVAAEPETSITLLEGMQNALGKGSRVLHAKGANIVNDPNVAARLNVFNPHDKPASIDERSPEKMIKEALKIAKKSDTIVLCLGEAKEHAGEAATRQDITIPQDQRPLFDTMAKYAKKSGKKLILVTMSGRPLALTHEAQHADAILQAWHPGTEAGNGIADILFGDANPSARLSVAFPRHVGQLPLKTEQLPTGRPAGNAPAQADGDQEVNEKGNRIFQKFTTSCIIEGPHTPLYPAGYGLSYTDFSYSAPQVNKTQLAGEGDVLEISFTLKNTGARAGEETPQLYIRDLVASISRPVLELKGFQKVKLEPGEERSVTFRITPDDLKFYNARTISDYTYDWEGGAFDIMVGPNSRDLQTLRVNWAKQPAPEATLAPEVK